ncbi:MAG: GAF domain-containing sensor histidine kinase [Azospirillaceae bacterium]
MSRPSPGPTPTNEAYRQAVLDAYSGAGTAEDRVLATLLDVTASRFSAPIALVTLIDRDRQCFAAAVGLPREGTARDRAFCAHTIMTDNELVVLDASVDPRFRDNPLVTGPPHIRFYAGAPLIAPEGVRLGSLCIIDPTRRERFDDADRAALRHLATLVVHRLADRRDTGEAAAEAVAAAGDRARRRILDLVGHELRTPLNAVVGFADLIAGGQTCGCPQTIDYGDHVLTAGRRLQRLIERVLSYAALDRGELPLADAPVPLGGLIAAAREQVLPEAGLVGVEIETAIGEDVGTVLTVDPDHAIQMVAALLANAIAASPPDAVVTVSLRHDPSGALGIAVSDIGNGMPEATLVRADRPFERGGAPHTARDGHVGLGLPLTRLLAEAHGGRLDLNTGPDGTTATLWLPAWRVGDGGSERPGTAAR